jgi:hypothetical protein
MRLTSEKCTKGVCIIRHIYSVCAAVGFIISNIPYCTQYTSKYKNQVQPELPCPFTCDNKRHYYAPVKEEEAHQCETDKVLHNVLTLTKISGEQNYETKP